MMTIKQVLAEHATKQQEYEETTYHGDFKIADLRKAFDAIQVPEDWRAEINAWIPPDGFKLVAAAVWYYTCTELKVVGGPRKLTGRILVHADGYRAGPCGP